MTNYYNLELNSYFIFNSHDIHLSIKCINQGGISFDEYIANVMNQKIGTLDYKSYQALINNKTNQSKKIYFWFIKCLSKPISFILLLVLINIIIYILSLDDPVFSLANK